MNLRNNIKDVIGYLRALNVLLLLWNIEEYVFPLDREFEKLLIKHYNTFEEMLRIVCDVCVAHSVYDEMRSSIDDIVDKEDCNFYDSEYTTAFLALLWNKRELPVFHYEDTSLFYRELIPIFDTVLLDLLSSILWVRVAYYDMEDAKTLPSPLPAIYKLFASINTLAPANLDFPPHVDYAKVHIKKWLSSEGVKKSLNLNVKRITGLNRVIEELENEPFA